MKIRLFSFIFLFPIILPAQQIQTDKDSLRIYESDSLFVTNIGVHSLTIDSLYTVNPLYGYWMDVYTNDSSFIYVANFPGYSGYGLLALNLEPNETAKFIFNYVDLCIVCKQNRETEYFQDTLVFVSNSILNDTTLIFTEGIGYTSSVNDDQNQLPVSLLLRQNYPNPFNPETKINYTTPNDGLVTINVFNMMGQLVKVLVNSYEPAGMHEVIFKGENLPSGVYLYRLQSWNSSVVKKMLLIK